MATGGGIAVAAGFNARPAFMQLYRHQQQAVEISRTRKRYGLFWEPGTGKTMAVLSICAERPMKTLVLAPRAVVDNAWLGDAKHFPSLKIVSGRAAGNAARLRIIESGWDVLCINYESFKKHLKDFIRVGVRRLVIDESQAAKNPKSQQTQAMVQMALSCEECYLLSGSPAPNGEHEYYSQLYCLSPQETGVNFWRWAGRWMIPQKRDVMGKTVITGWRLMDHRRKDFEAMLARHSWSLNKSQCVDLPDKVDILWEFDLDGAEREAYNRMLEELRIEWDGATIDATTAGKMMKLRQVCGGAVLDKAGQAHIIGESKMDQLREVLDEIGGRPVIVWAIFTADLDRIAAATGGKVVDGRTTDNLRNQHLADFGRTFNILCAHPQAIGHGVTLTQASYAIYYSMGFSFEHYVQSRDRIHRIGQKNTCVYYHLIAKDTVDERVLAVVQGKQSRHEALRAVLTGAQVDLVREQIAVAF